MSMKKVGTLGKLFAALLFAAAAGCAATQPSGPEPRVLAAKDDGGELRLAVGETFSVELESNPSTGFHWQLADAGSSGVLKPAGDEFHAPDTERCGAPGVQKLSFRAAAPGEAVLKLVYVRPWEKNRPPMRSFQVKVTVERP